MHRKTICYSALRRYILYGLLILAIIAAAVGITVGILRIKPQLTDENAKTGVPENIPKEYGYSMYEAAEVCKAAVCGNPKIEEKDLFVYLTNPKTNDVFIRAEIYEAELIYKDGKVVSASPGKLLGKTGFIKPGEYVEKLHINRDLKGEQLPVMIKIATYIEQSRESKGFFYVNTVLNP